ncbi:MAG: (d)CMP kinase [Firmicutes bacterium]|nr:(d)CMP kinase [Bacillota bacterium]
MKNIVIAIDGPAGAGKSTIAKILAKRLNIIYIDTGAMYRAFTYKFLKNNKSIEDKEAIKEMLDNTEIDFRNNHIFLDGKIVDNEIRKNKVSKNVSNIAKIKEVREKLVLLQRKIANNKSVVMDGRDIGSNVFPDADYKFFINASAQERGTRRYKELEKKGTSIKLENIINEIKQRDKIDSTRKLAPLTKTEDAIEINTTDLTIEETIEKVLSNIRERG